MSQAQPHKLTSNIKAAGCAAKLSPAELSQIVRKLPPIVSTELLTSAEHFEDAAVWKLTDELAVIQTIDFFPPVIDDPFLFGRIAAVNAISDVYAMGGRPVLALNVFGFPTCDLDLEVAERIIEGGAAAATEAGVVLAGGHSIQTKDPIYGMAVMGLIHPKRILTNGGAKAQDALVLCKAIGSGVALLALKAEMLSAEAAGTLIESLSRLNKQCLELAQKYPINALTDVTGFGFLGHLHEMSQASGLTAQIDSKKVPLLPEVKESAEQGLVPAGAYANRKAYMDWVGFDSAVDLAMQDLFFDPQTSGGLLISLAAEHAQKLEQELQAAGWPAACVGKFIAGQAGRVEVF